MAAIQVGGFDGGRRGRSAKRHHVARVTDEPRRSSLTWPAVPVTVRYRQCRRARRLGPPCSRQPQARSGSRCLSPPSARRPGSAGPRSIPAQSRRKSTAVLAFNDLLAVGCLIALKSAGIACPKQISLTGINDLRFMDLLSPPLTSLHTAGRALGFESAELLMSLIGNHSQPVKRVLLTPHIIVRGTTGPAPAPDKADRLTPVRADP
ncbi:hypothetical protein GFL49_19880 [Rhizobium leguminosarum bv. viciae]|nr:hypothetical protein [Rhizobium leguminosarum bv. viciae]